MPSISDLRIALHRTIWDTLNEMAVDDELSDLEKEEVRASMELLADLVVERLNLEFRQEGNSITISFNPE